MFKKFTLSTIILFTSINASFAADYRNTERQVEASDEDLMEDLTLDVAKNIIKDIEHYVSNRFGRTYSMILSELLDFFTDSDDDHALNSDVNYAPNYLLYFYEIGLENDVAYGDVEAFIELGLKSIHIAQDTMSNHPEALNKFVERAIQLLQKMIDTFAERRNHILSFRILNQKLINLQLSLQQ